MTPDTITQRIHDKSDRDLRAKLESSIEFVLKEVSGSYECPKDVAALNKSLGGSGLPEHKDFPWIGAIHRQFVEVSFAYLHERFREKAVSEFMQKVESVGEIINQQ